jgi:hypothetical protein
MANTPKGREIKWIDGNGGDIEARGTQIENLGQQMIDAAAILKSIADGADGMKGLSVKKIRDVVSDDVHKELKEAGELYKPTGTILKDYGSVLGDVHSGMRTLIEDCNDLWEAYQAELKQANSLKSPFRADPLDLTPDEETQEEKDAKKAKQDAIETAEGEADAALAAFNLEADKFDAKYDTWDEAYDIALEKIGDVTDGAIEDSWKDDLSGFVEVALKVLAVIGLVLAVLCLVIGGPFLAILATIAAILTLIGTLYMFSQGHADGWDVAWAVVGVIPFGKLGKFLEPTLTTGQKFTGFLKGFGAIDEFGELGNSINAFRMSRAFGNGFMPALLDGLSGGTLDGAGVLARYMGLSRTNGSVNLLELIGGHHGDILLKGGGNGGRDLLGLIGDAQSGNSVDNWRDQLARNN